MAALVEAMDRCWLDNRLDDLRTYIADDVVFVAPGGARVAGIDAAIESYREFLSRCTVERFEPSGHTVTLRGDAAVVEYGWSMGWRDGATRHDDSGREVVVFARRRGEWKLVWRMQVPA